MGTMEGAYTSLNNGIRYTYELTWREAGDGIVWSAIVRRDGREISKPSGQIRSALRVDVKTEVRRLVERAIDASTGGQ